MNSPTIADRVRRAAIKFVKTGGSFSAMQVLADCNSLYTVDQERVTIQQALHALNELERSGHLTRVMGGRFEWRQ